MTQVQVLPVIIPHFRAKEKLERCIQAVQAQTGLPDHLRVEIFVRDNSEDNILFTRAINQGLRQYCYRDDCQAALILNQDAYLKPSCLMELLKALAQDPRAGIVCPVQLDTQERVTWRGSLRAFPWGQHRGGPAAPQEPPFETPWANGAAMLVRVQMVREIGLLDENMRFICSDADYSFTARARGWRVLCAPAAQTQHALDASGQQSDAWLSQIKLQDHVFFAHKWLTGGVYRQLALEGPELTPEAVQKELAQSQATLQYLTEQIRQKKQ